MICSQGDSLPPGLFTGLPECPQDTAERISGGEAVVPFVLEGSSTLFSFINFIPAHS